jgi:hypothetical protein
MITRQRDPAMRLDATRGWVRQSLWFCALSSVLATLTIFVRHHIVLGIAWAGMALGQAFLAWKKSREIADFEAR